MKFTPRSAEAPQNKTTDRYFGVVNRLGVKLTILSMLIIFAADILTFTAKITIDYIMGGTSDTTDIIGAVAASALVGSLIAFSVGNCVLKPLSLLIKATKRVANGDFSVKLDIGWIERYTIKELRELIRDFNEMTEELRNTELFRKDFIASFSHEFKTPLASIRGFARQLNEGNLTPEQQKEFSRIILDETEYLSIISQNTLLMTNLENRDIVPDKAKFSLDEQLRGCMIRLEPKWSAKDIEIDMEGLFPVDLFWNEQLLAHVWSNLFDNAVKYTPKGGTVKVSCKKSDRRIIVTVSDSGCGIPEEALPRIFEKFYRADASRATKGNGLGLSIVKRIIDLAEGEISVSSEQGKGTTFTVTLPDAVQGGN